MKKIVLLAMVLSLLMVGVAFAGSPTCPPPPVDCGKYTVGYSGYIKFCLMPGLDIGAEGATATLKIGTFEKVFYADCSGKYEAKKAVNNCPTGQYSYPQEWSICLDLAPSRLGSGTWKCKTSQTFFCCCPVCNQKVIAKCDKTFKGPCCDPLPPPGDGDDA